MTQAIPTAIEALRRKSLDIVDETIERARDFALPEPPEALGLCRRKLAENAYRVLVVGEAKRGKTSFVNALIGRPILPADVDIATSQVFLVNQAAQEAYRLRFEDGSSEDIVAADLPRYGSQVLADVEGTPRLDRIIRWIEVDVPVRFLPDGVSLLDTPGLGSLYAAHSQITQRFLPHADAVVFVLDSTQPIGFADLQVVEAILAVTSSLFFIQTRIDQFRKAQWQALLARNEQVLRERFADRLADARVWPISSANLMKAAETGDADYEIVSRHPELAAAFQTFLFRVSGLSRAAAAMALADRYRDTAGQVLLGRIADLTERSKERRIELQREMAERRRRFDHDWGEGGPGRRRLQEALQRIVAAGKQTLRQALDTGGEIERAVRAKIDGVASFDDAERLAETLAAETVAAAVQIWQETDRQVRTLTVKQLEPFMEALEILAQTSYAGPDGPSADRERCRLETRDDPFERLKGGFVDFRNAFGMAGGGIALSALASVAGSVVLSTLAAGAAVVAGVWALFRGYKGWQRAGEIQLGRARQELRQHLGEVRDRVRRYYFDIDLGAGRHRSLVEEHFDRLLEDIGAQVQRLARERSEESRQELARRVEQAKLDERERAARLAELRDWLAQWDRIGQGIQCVVDALADLDRELTRPRVIETENQE
jgi:GTPase SAR1 family protein